MNIRFVIPARSDSETRRAKAGIQYGVNSSGNPD